MPVWSNFRGGDSFITAPRKRAASRSEQPVVPDHTRSRGRRRGHAAAYPLPSPALRFKPGFVKQTLFLLSAASFIVVAVMTVMTPLLPLIADEFARSIGNVGLVVSAFAVPYGAFQIVFGPLGDRYGKLRTVALALGASTVFTLACGLVGSLEGLVVMRFLTGLAMAGTVPLAMAFIADEVPFAERQPVMGRYINGLVLGQIAGGSLGGIAAEYFAWRHIFFVFAGMSALISACLWWQAGRSTAPLRAHRQHPAAVLRVYRELLAERHSRDMIITGTLEGMLIFGVLAYFGAFLRQRHGLDYVVIGLLLGMYGAGGIIYSAAVYRIVALLGERGMVIAGTLLLGVCYLLICVVPKWWALVPIFTLAGFGFYMFHNTMQTRASELSSEARGTAIALWVFMLFAGQGLGVVVFGAVIDRAGYAAAFVSAGCGIVALGWWTQGHLLRRRH